MDQDEVQSLKEQLRARGPLAGCFSPGLENAKREINKLFDAAHRAATEDGEAAGTLGRDPGKIEQLREWVLMVVEGEYAMGMVDDAENG